jgi:hypothetical protein
MQKLPARPRRPLSPEQQAHAAATREIQEEGMAARQARASEREAADAAAAAKTTDAHEFAGGVERRRLQAAAAGRDRARMSLPMDY